jgi:threonine dehydrogenase-like Zn-dependent dehydrogenase
MSSVEAAPTHLALARRPGYGPLAAKRLPRPALAPGDLLCRTHVAGVCGTDLQILAGMRDDSAMVLGHEGLLTVEAVTDKQDEALLGQRVVFNPTNPETGKAELGHSLSGLMQQRCLVPKRMRPLVLLAPPGLTAELAVFAEPLASVLFAAEVMAAMARPERVLSVGRGTIGRLLQVALPRVCGSVRDVVVTAAGGDGGIEASGFDAAILCASRETFANAMRIGLQNVRPDGVVHLFGGLPPDYRDRELPDVDLACIRSRNSGGLRGNPAGDRVAMRSGGSVMISGHRGASNAMIGRAMEELVANAEFYLPLLTIVSTPEAAIGALAGAIERPPSRAFTKLGIDMRSW